MRRSPILWKATNMMDGLSAEGYPGQGSRPETVEGAYVEGRNGRGSSQITQDNYDICTLHWAKVGDHIL